jgi:2',3'-cyclic-nucleotide 2'-phosphodiesterase (5'-nucleotidase family)
MILKLTMALIILFFQFGFSECFAVENGRLPNAVILYTGDIQGNLNPKGCCTNIGGLARRATRIQELRKKYEHTILLDTGDYVSNENADWLNQLIIRQTAEAYKIIRYDFLNIADNELISGDKFFDSFLSVPALSLVSTNLYSIERNTKINPYSIKQVGKFRFAIIGILSDHFLNGIDHNSITINDPVKSIKKYLPEIKNQSDFIILMSHAGIKRTRDIIDEIPDINIAIVGHDVYATFESETVGNTRIFKNATGGSTIGAVKVWINQTGQIEKIKDGLELLDKRVKPAQAYYMLENKFNYEKKKAMTINTN